MDAPTRPAGSASGLSSLAYDTDASETLEKSLARTAAGASAGGGSGGGGGGGSGSGVRSDSSTSQCQAAPAVTTVAGVGVSATTMRVAEALIVQASQPHLGLEYTEAELQLAEVTD